MISELTKNNLAKLYMAISGIVLCTTSNIGYPQIADEIELLDLQLEDLLNVQVTSASKKRESLNDVASSVYVLSNEDIQRAGVTNVPDALRMVPGIQVARIDSNKWAVTSRGFNGRFANKLLVMVDGRTVYSPTYSGVYWEMQDVRLEDVERVEVIRGPGGSVWGANAVNGVINIITKHAADTLGTEVVVGTGDYEKLILNGRMGGKVGDNGYARAYVNANSRGELIRADGKEGDDAWDTYRIGARLDKTVSINDNIVVMADFSQGDLDQEVTYAIYSAPYEAVDTRGVDYTTWNLMTRWEHTLSTGSEWSMQFYYDHIDRVEFMLDEVRDTYDLDFTHRFQLGKTQEFVWGLGYRLMDDTLTSTTITTVEPESRKNELFSAFFQDQIALNNELSLILGAKWEHNEYTGDEMQPSAKINWRVSDSTQLWTSAAKAVRTPAIIEVDSEFLGVTLPPLCSSPPAASCPPPTNLPLVTASAPSPRLESEELVAYEVGLRSALSPTLNIDVVFFYNDYSELRSFSYDITEIRTDPVDHFFVGATFINANSGENHGVELATNWAPTDKWLFTFSYSFIENNIEWENPYDIHQNTPAPRHQASLLTSYKLSETIETNLWLRYVGDAQVIRAYEPSEIDAYTAMDLNIAWQVTPAVELRLVGQNLLDSSHPEYIQELLIDPTEVERSVYGKITIDF